MGSFCIHPLAMAAGIAFLEEIEKGNYIQNARARATQLCDGINKIPAARKLDIHAHTTYTVVHFGISGQPTMAEALDILEFDLTIRLGLLLGNPGATVLPGHVYMSGVHSEKDIELCLPAFEKAFSLYK
jgi:glutamate-1-semialdehyde aminotransferase